MWHPDGMRSYENTSRITNPMFYKITIVTDPSGVVPNTIREIILISRYEGATSLPHSYSIFRV